MVSHDCKCQVCGKPFKHRGTDAHVCSVACNEAPTPKALARAISSLGAVEVAPGRYAIPNLEQEGRWHIADAAGAIGSAFDEDVDFRGHRYVEMPSWWSPERRFAVRSRADFAYRHPYPTLVAAACGCGSGQTIVTADLTTGEEVPA